MNNFPIGDKPSSKGPMFGTIIIVILIIIGGIYIISSRQSNETGVVPPPVNEETGTPGGIPADTSVTPTADTQAAALDGLKSVETDLNASETDLQNLDRELQ